MHISKSVIIGGMVGLLMSLGVAADEYLEEAREYYANGEYRAAIIQLKNALQERPDYTQARLMLARVYLETGNAAASEKEFRHARRLGVERTEWVKGLGGALLQQRKFDELLQQIQIHDGDASMLQADIMVLRAQARVGMQEREKAEELYRQALNRDAEHLDAHLGLAGIALNTGDYPQATEHLERALDIDSHSFAATLLKAELLAVQDNDLATEWYDKALELQPDSIQASFGKAKYLIKQRKFDAADPIVKKLRETLPDSFQVAYLSGMIAFHDGDYDKSLEEFNKVLSVRPDFSPVMIFLGTIHYQRGNLDQAELYLRNYLEYKPEHIPTRQMLGGVYLRKAKAEEAVNVLKPLAEAARGNAGYMAQLGMAFMQVGKHESAMQYLGYAHEAAPDALPVKAQLAMGHIILGEHDAGLEELRSLAEAQGEFKYDRLLVLSYLALEDYPAALRTVEGLRQKYPDNAEVLHMHAVTYLAAGEQAPAREIFRTLVENKPGFAAAYINLANIEFSNGNYDEADAILRTALERGIESPRIFLSLARLAETDGDAGRAEKLYRQAYSDFDNSLVAGIAYSDYLVRVDDTERAISVLTSLNQSHPDEMAVLARLAVAQLDEEMTSAARISIDKMLENSPQSAFARYLSGRLQLMESDSESAVEALEYAVDNGFRNPQSLAFLAQAYSASGLNEKFSDTLSQLKNEYPDSGIGFEIEGDSDLKDGDARKALMAYERAYERDPHKQLLIKMYRLRMARGEIDESLSLLRDWLAAHPDDAKTRLLYASVLSQAGDYEAALDQYSEVIAISSEHVVALNNAAVVAVDIDPETGLRYARKAYELAPDRAEIIDTYGWLLLKNGDSRKAESLLKEAAIRAPHIADIRYHLAVAYYENNKSDQALLELKAIKDKFGELQDAEHARSLYSDLMAGN